MSYSVLVVDDAGFVREILGQLIKSLGHEVVAEARDGEEAVELARKFKPEVILLDLVLPKKNGLDVAIEIHEFLPQARIIAVSTLPAFEFETRAKEAGCSVYLVKPFSRKDVANAFESLPAKLRMVQNG